MRPGFQHHRSRRFPSYPPCLSSVRSGLSGEPSPGGGPGPGPGTGIGSAVVTPRRVTTRESRSGRTSGGQMTGMPVWTGVERAGPSQPCRWPGRTGAHGLPPLMYVSTKAGLNGPITVMLLPRGLTGIGAGTRIDIPSSAARGRCAGHGHTYGECETCTLWGTRHERLSLLVLRRATGARGRARTPVFVGVPRGGLPSTGQFPRRGGSAAASGRTLQPASTSHARDFPWLLASVRTSSAAVAETGVEAGESLLPTRPMPQEEP